MPLLAQAADGAASSGAEVALFWTFAVLAMGSAVAVVSLRNIVHAALMLVLNLLSIAALYLGLQSAFLSIVQVIVYAGAIVVLFLFVIMLLGVDRDDLLGTKSPLRAVAAVVAGVALASALLVVLGDSSLTAASACGAQATEGASDAVVCVGLDAESADSVGFVGAELFTRWTFAFEASALLLVVATLGALVLGRRHDSPEEADLEPSAPMPDRDDLDAITAAHEPVGAEDDDDLVATFQVRPAHDATATLDPADDMGSGRPDEARSAEPGGEAASGDRTVSEASGSGDEPPSEARGV